MEFKEKSEELWLPASDVLEPVLSIPAIANEMGDRKEIAFRLNIPPSAEQGSYKGEVTVIADAH